MKKKKNINCFSFLLAIILIIVNIFRNKLIYLAPILIVSVSSLIYPITFLLVILIFKKYKIKEAKESIIMSALFVLLFYLLCTLFCSLNSTIDSQNISNMLRETLTPNHFKLYNIVIYYPQLLPLFASTIIYILSHYIFVVVYEAIEDLSNYFIAFMLSILISFIIDQMFYVPIVNIVDIWNLKISFIGLIKMMTANFFITIISSIVMLFVYPLCLKKKD